MGGKKTVMIKRLWDHNIQDANQSRTDTNTSRKRKRQENDSDDADNDQVAPRKKKRKRLKSSKSAALSQETDDSNSDEGPNEDAFGMKYDEFCELMVGHNCPSQLKKACSRHNVEYDGEDHQEVVKRLWDSGMR